MLVKRVDKERFIFYFFANFEKGKMVLASFLKGKMVLASFFLVQNMIL